MPNLTKVNFLESSMHKLHWLLNLVIIMVLAGCSTSGADLSNSTSLSPDDTPSAQPLITTEKPAQHTLIIFAAASLTNAFQVLGKYFENTHPGVSVQFNFTGSQIARMQIE